MRRTVRKVTEEFEDRFYDHNGTTLNAFVREALSERDQKGFSLVMTIKKDSDDELICNAMVSYSKD